MSINPRGSCRRVSPPVLGAKCTCDDMAPARRAEMPHPSPPARLINTPHNPRSRHGKSRTGDAIEQSGRGLQIQPIHRKNPSIPPLNASMKPLTHQNCAASPPGNIGSGTFIPQAPTISVSGMKMVDSTVSTFMI